MSMSRMEMETNTNIIRNPTLRVLIRHTASDDRTRRHVRLTQTRMRYVLALDQHHLDVA